MFLSVSCNCSFTFSLPLDFSLYHILNNCRVRTYQSDPSIKRLLIEGLQITFGHLNQPIFFEGGGLSNDNLKWL